MLLQGTLKNGLYQLQPPFDGLNLSCSLESLLYHSCLHNSSIICENMSTDTSNKSFVDSAVNLSINAFDLSVFLHHILF